MNNESFINPTHANVESLLKLDWQGPVTMLNLLRFREVADYSESPELQPKRPISGWEAYELYVQQAQPFIEKVGSTLVLKGIAGPYLIGPPEERWDAMMIVNHLSPASFLSFIRNDGFMKVVGHRTAALKDSRLLPVLV